MKLFATTLLSTLIRKTAHASLIFICVCVLDSGSFEAALWCVVRKLSVWRRAVCAEPLGPISQPTASLPSRHQLFPVGFTAAECELLRTKWWLWGVTASRQAAAATPFRSISAARKLASPLLQYIKPLILKLLRACDKSFNHGTWLRKSSLQVPPIPLLMWQLSNGTSYYTLHTSPALYWFAPGIWRTLFRRKFGEFLFQPGWNLEDKHMCVRREGETWVSLMEKFPLCVLRQLLKSRSLSHHFCHGRRVLGNFRFHWHHFFLISSRTGIQYIFIHDAV